jgi:hypothetical protein
LETSQGEEADYKTLQIESVESATEPVEEAMVDCTTSPTHMDINMVYYMPAEIHATNEDGEVAQIDFRPRDAVFENPKELVKNLKPL